ncbi:hypothetical protein BGX21_008691 [Mortierella sp. AD011]|nr:hypothetical protein BGX20_009319 [Mortierella sp. AD010]KAF9402795.1 hypothetical protein BGX21_008691 [Mortierella sp. AD011]
MTPQVKDFEAFLALDAPATPPPFPPQQHTPLPPSQQHTPSSTESFFEDISNLEDTINDSTATNTLATPNPFSNVPLSPIQLVAISNLKLNNDMYSNRSLSIHRRILVKNFLTLLYELSPSMDWMQHGTYPGDAFEPLPGLDAPVPDEGNMLLREDEQNGWMERTLSAAGLNDDDDNVPLGISSKIQNTNPPATTKSSPATTTTTTTTATSSAPPLLTLSFNTSSSPSASSNNSQQAPLPRPKSTELPQTLHSYLSTVFDVNWSVELPSKEDILFTHAPSTNPSTSSSSPSPPISSVASKRKSISAASGLSSAFTAYSNGNAPSSSASSASPRSSTSSSFSSVSATSTVSSASSVGSIGNESTILIGYNKPGELNNGNNNLTGATKATPATATLVRKSSLTSLSKPASSTQAAKSAPANSPPANNSVNNINGVLSENRNLLVKKASVNGHSKPTLVPGRRSSLLQAGQIPPTLPSAKNNNTSNNMGVNGPARTNSVATTGEAANSLSPAMPLPPSRSPTSLSPPTLSPPTFLSASTSPTLSPSKPTSPTLTPSLPTSPNMTPLKPTISRRTSSLPSERPKPAQRALSSESNLSVSTAAPSTGNATTLSVPEANIIGLPRPLLSPTLSSAVLSSSPPSQSAMTTSPTSITPPVSGSTRYMRSASDDQFTVRPNNTPYAQNSFGVPEKSPSSPNLYSSPPPPPLPSAQSGTLSRPTASYLKTSKSSPCLAGPESVSWDKSSLPPLPDQYYQQQYQSQASSDMLAPGHGAMVSAPLSLIPNNPSYNDYPGYDGHNHNNNNNNTRPYGHGRGHSYAQSMSNVSVTSNSSVATNNSSKTSRSQVSEKPAAGRWSSMKTMFGLRGGQSTKG